MDFAFSEDQDLLREQVRKLLAQQSPLAEVRRAIETPEGFSRSLWNQLGELGFTGLGLPEAYGGAGLGWVDLTVLLEESGRQLTPSPLVSTLLTGATLLDAGSDAQRERWLPALASGERIGTLAFLERPDGFDAGAVELAASPEAGGFVLEGEKHYVEDVGRADLFVVAFRTGPRPDAVSLAVVEADAAGVSTEALEGLDATHRSGVVRFDGARVEAEALLGAPGGGAAALRRALDRGAVAVTAEAIGSLEAALEITTEFAKQRIQFGSPIGRYQGVKHRLAEWYVDVESLKSLLYFAAWALDAAPDRAPLAASEAKAFGSDAFTRHGVMGVQLHGAVGFTDEYDIQLYLKRSKWYRQAFGDEAVHADRIAALGGW